MSLQHINISNLERLKSEEKFHDKLAHSIKVEDLLVFENFEAITTPENRFILKEFGDISGKRLLDVGCGAGESSVYFALQGAKVTAVDISAEMLKLTQKLASKYHVTLEVFKLPIENISSLNQSFDYIHGNGVMHHVDFKRAAYEISKVLTVNGKAVFIEPLSYNPIIDVYRKLAKGVHTPYERPLNFKDIEYFREYFGKVRHKEFWFLSLIIFISFFFQGLNPSKVRYWKYIIEHAEDYENLYCFLSFLDNNILKRFPFLRRFCWNTVIVLEEPFSAS